MNTKKYRFVDGFLANVVLCMGKVWKFALVCTVYLAATATHLMASEQASVAHQDSGHFHQNIAELFLGNTYEDGIHGSENGFSIGVTYERRLSKLFGVGGFCEYVAGDFEKWSIGVPLFFHPYKGWRFELAPGLEHRDNENEFLFRIGAAYEFMLSDRLIMMPEISVDFVDGEEAIVFGLVFGFGF